MLLLFVQCTKENEYLVEKGKVGYLNAQTSIKELKDIFKYDSIKIHTVLMDEKVSENLFFNDSEDFEIFSKEGKKLLTITPVKESDSVSKIKSIQIFDAHYKTKKGLGIESNFKQIKNNYEINKIETTLTSATLYIDELNATIAIDKEEIGVSKFSREEIFIDQIPDVSKIKFFTIWFN